VISAPGGLVAAAGAGIEDSVKDAPKKEEEKTAESAAERKDLQNNHAADPSAQIKQLAIVSRKLAPLRPLLARVQQYACESDVGDFVEVTNNEPQSHGSKPGNGKKADYVFEVAMTGLKLKRTLWIRSEGESFLYMFTFNAQGELVRTNDNSVVDTFVTNTTTNPRALDALTADDGKQLFAAFDAELDELAKQFVDKWIKPTLQAAH